LKKLFSRSPKNGNERVVLELAEPFWPVPDAEHVRASWLRAEEISGTGSTYSITLDGWVVGKNAGLQALEVAVNEICIWRLSVNVLRPDVQEIHPDLVWSERSGFHHYLSALKLPLDFAANVGAVFTDGNRALLATVRGKRAPLDVPRSRINPLSVTTLGRTGSTWVLALLGRHPEIISFRPFEYEAKVIRYWTDIFAELSEPASYRQPLSAELYGEDWWIGRDRQAPPPTVYDKRIESWLGGPNVQELARFSHGRIAAFYDEVAIAQGKRGARYFAEKILPGTIREQLLPELFPGMKEIFLVRDPRDMASSVLDYDRRREFSGFIREEGESDEEYVRRELRRDLELLAASWASRAERSHMLRYEDLVLRPEAALAAVFSYLGLDSSPALVKQILEEAEASVPSVRRKHQTSASPAASIGRWERDPPEIRAAFDEAFGDLLGKLGYATTAVTGNV
jgi:Sulfotransferase family